MIFSQHLNRQQARPCQDTVQMTPDAQFCGLGGTDVRHE